MSNNPYEKIYDQLNITITEQTTFEQAQLIAKHLGYIYNTFGVIVKDFISMLGYRFRSQHAPNSLNGNKKDKKNVIKDLKIDKKTKLDEKTAQQQLEGKNKTPPHTRLIKEIKNYQSSNKPDLGLQEQFIKSKLLQLRQEKKLAQNNSNQKVSNSQEKQQQKQQISNNPTKISFKKKNVDSVVINISSSDQEKEDDQKNGVKTRAQLRGVTKTFLRPETLLKRGRGKRGRPRKIGRVARDEQESSESSEQRSLKGSSYPLDPNDPFTIIYNVPYRPKNLNGESKQTIGLGMSKKQQKNEKILQKRDSHLNSSSLNSEQEQKCLSKPVQQEKKLKSIESVNFKKNFIDKVKASYMQEKQAIKDRLQNLDRQFREQKDNERFKGRKKLQLDSDNEIEDDQQEDQMINEEYEQFSNHDQDEQNGDNNEFQQEEKKDRSNEINDKDQIESQMQENKQVHLQWLNNSIQQEFEENLRMNEQISNNNNEDEYEEEVYLTQQQQNQEIQQVIIGDEQNHDEDLVREQEIDEISFNNHQSYKIRNQHQQNHVRQQHDGDEHSQNENKSNNAEQQEQQQVQNQVEIMQHYDQVNHQQNQSQISPEKHQQIPILINNQNHNNTDEQVLRMLQQFQSQSDQHQYDHIINNINDNSHHNKVNNISDYNNQYEPMTNFISQKNCQSQKNTHHITELSEPITKTNENVQLSQNKSFIANEENKEIKSLTQPLNPTQKSTQNDYQIYNKKTKPIEIIDLQ